MSAKRRSERGWNQTEILCEEILRLHEENLFEYAPHALVKEKHTESQARTLSKRDRMTNVQLTMEVRDPEKIKNRNIVLLDDVTTTGATFKDARRALKEAGARKILCLALAH
jgi:competence protein ComFC